MRYVLSFLVLIAAACSQSVAAPQHGPVYLEEVPLGFDAANRNCELFFPNDMTEVQMAVAICGDRTCWTGLVIWGIDDVARPMALHADGSLITDDPAIYHPQLCRGEGPTP